jgi:hypothetical protein
MYFLFAGFHLAFCTYMFIGIPSSGSGGLINLISRFASGSIVSGVFCILATVGWALEGLASLWMYKNVSLLSLHQFLRSTDEVSFDALRFGLTLTGNKVIPSLKRNQRFKCTDSSSMFSVANQRICRQTRVRHRLSKSFWKRESMEEDEKEKGFESGSVFLFVFSV